MMPWYTHPCYLMSAVFQFMLQHGRSSEPFNPRCVHLMSHPHFVRHCLRFLNCAHMYIPDTSSIPDNRLFAPTLPLDGSTFSLDISGVVGLFGGDEAVSAMATLHAYKGRRWLGWYNSPGSYQIARRYGLLATSRLFASFFPGVRIEPTALFELDNWKGPKFRAVHSGTVIEETGHISALLLKECAALQGSDVGWRKTQPIGVTIIELNYAPQTEVYPTPISAYYSIPSIFPIGVSFGTCVACGVFADWYSFLMILLGILATGITYLIIGSGTLVFKHPEPAKGCPPGDGILGSDKEIVLLRGTEGAVNSVTRGCFSLNFPSEPQHKSIGWCSVLLATQFMAQLFLIPQGSLFGQVMFVSSLAASWIYNLWLSSLDKERIQRNILVNNVLQNPVFTKYSLGTRTTMVVFVLLVLQLEKPTKLLNELLPNDTRVWEHWKDTIVQRLLDHVDLEFVESDWEAPTDFTEEEKSLLATLYRDSQAAYHGYIQYAASN